MQLIITLFILSFSITTSNTNKEDSDLTPSWYLEFNDTGGFNYYHCCCDGNGVLCTGPETQAKCRPGGIFECEKVYSSEPDYNVTTNCDDCCATNNGNPCA